MTKTIELAQQAEIGDSHGYIIRNELPNLERFAELVRADERARLTDERIMEVARRHWKLPGTDVIDFVRELLA